MKRATKKDQSMRKHIHVTKSIVGILCAGSLMAAMTSAANPFRRQLEQGTIQNIDPQQSTLTVRDARNGSTHSYMWNQETKFLQHPKDSTIFTRSKAIGAADLKSGEQVDVFYKQEGGHTLARKVVVTNDGQASGGHKESAETQS
jgi:hypothetical protein